LHQREIEDSFVAVSSRMTVRQSLRVTLEGERKKVILILQGSVKELSTRREGEVGKNEASSSRRRAKIVKETRW